jgi:lipopolysaccharide/colanic/teichoic acid biosynthesis glycosyltransferase/glycosyltransferase involved in cell wall biosynthesis
VRILILTQWFDPEPAFKGLAFASKLSDCGHEVEVLTGFPNYPEGRLYPGWRLRLWQRQQAGAISVIRVPLFPSHDRSAFRRALNYLSFAFAAAILGPFLARRPDAIYVYHPPATVGLAALALKLRFRAPILYDVNDLWPDTVLSTGMLSGGFAFHLLHACCRFLYRRADRITVVSPGFRRTLIERGVNADRLHMVYNWAPGEPLVPSLQAKPRQDGRFQIVFAGNMGLAQGLDAVLDAAALCAVPVPRAFFRFVGGGLEVPRLRKRARIQGLSNVEFLERQSFAAAQAIIQEADVLLVHLKDDPLFAITIPSKTQSYLAAGRPILMAVRGDAAGLVEQAGAGVLAEPGNPQSIADAVRRLAEMPPSECARMGQNGRAFYERELSLDRAAARFDGLFRDIVLSPPQYAVRGKRLFDIAVSLTALLLLWPLLVIVAVAVRCVLGAPVLFRQTRPGWKERPFSILKFRTMRDGDAPDAERLSALGRFLRAASLDELPELWNVLRGDMSLVGPRPLLPQYLPRYTARQRRRHEVRPGITGWAQIHGRNAITWEEKFDLDVWYVDHACFLLDFRILFRTLGDVFRRKGIRAEGHATMPEFLGENRAA